MVISPISYYFPEYLADIDTKMPMKETTRPPLKFQVHLYRRVMGLFCVLSFIPISCICPKHPPLKCTMLSLLERNLLPRSRKTFSCCRSFFRRISLFSLCRNSVPQQYKSTYFFGLISRESQPICACIVRLFPPFWKISKQSFVTWLF